MGDAPHGPLVFGVDDDSGGGGPSTIAVALDGTVEVPAATIVNFVPTPPVAVSVVEFPAGVANVRIAHPGGGGGGFTDYQWAEHEPEEQTNNAAWLNVLSLGFQANAGLYRLAWSTEVDSNGTYIGVRVRWQPGGAGPFTLLAMGEITAGALHDPHGGIVVGLGLGDADQLFEIDIQSGGPPTTVGARRTRMDLFRIGPTP
jgi:hypothetical protein